MVAGLGRPKRPRPVSESGHAPGRGRELADAPLRGAGGAAPACRLIATLLGPGDNLVVERRCLVAASPGVTVDVAFSRALRRRGEAGRVVLMRLTGVGVAFLQAAESSTELELATGEELEAPVAWVVCFEASAEYELRLARIGGV